MKKYAVVNAFQERITYRGVEKMLAAQLDSSPRTELGKWEYTFESWWDTEAEATARAQERSAHGNAHSLWYVVQVLSKTTNKPTTEAIT